MSLNVSTLISTSAILIIQMAESMRVAQCRRKKKKKQTRSLFKNTFRENYNTENAPKLNEWQTKIPLWPHVPAQKKKQYAR